MMKIILGITPEMLDNKNKEILDYINSFSCAEASGCNSIAFGAKPCGPREFWFIKLGRSSYITKLS